MAENQEWQKIAGTSACELYPFERKPDVKSCNTYIVQSEYYSIVIDPGADEKQADRIADILHQRYAAQKKPALILLTHCHFDHFKAALRLLERLQIPRFFCAQESGAYSLESGDEKLTLSFLFNQTWTPPSVDVKLLAKTDRENLGIREIHLEETHRLVLHSQVKQTPDGNELFLQSLPIGERDSLYFYHTPGHSPDSLCIHIGHCLFTGDLLLAASPGVAGAVGWNQAELLRSLQNVLGLLRETGVAVCYLGHGRSLPGAQTQDIIEKNIHYVKKLTDIAVLDSNRAHFLGRYTKDLLNEISDLFVVISGKLLSISYHLNNLSEEEEARNILAKLDIDSIDKFLSEFNQYATDYSSENRLEMEIPLKANQIIAKIQSVFVDAQLQDVIDVSLLRRARWLILDFLRIMQGFREEILGQGEDVNRLFVDYLTDLKKPRFVEKDLLESTSDESSFVRELIRRIALRNIFETVDISFTSSIGVPAAYLEKERLLDMTTSLLETIAVAGAKRISVRSWYTNGADSKVVAIEIEPQPALDYSRFWQRKIPFAQRVFQMFGGTIHEEKQNGAERLIIELPPADNYFPVR